MVKIDPESDINRPDIAQPLCTAVQISLVNLLKSWGITPDKVIGHSSGEFAAAYAANALSMATAIILAHTRGIIANMAPEGGMLAVGVGRDSISQYLGDAVELACENSPNSVTLAGSRDQLECVATRIQNEQPDTLLKMLPVERAYHSGESYKTYAVSFPAKWASRIYGFRGCRVRRALTASPSQPSRGNDPNVLNGNWNSNHKA